MYNRRIGPFKNVQMLPFVNGIDPRRWTVDELVAQDISPVPERTADVTRMDFGWMTQGATPQFAYHLGPASHVAAVRFTFVLNRPTDKMSWPRMDWADASRGLGYAPERSIVLNGIKADPASQTLTVWIWDHADYVRFALGAGESLTSIERVEILRKPPELLQHP